MNSAILRRTKWLVAAVGLLAGITQFCYAQQGSRVSGSYEVVQKLHVGATTRVRLHLHLTNPGPRDFNIQSLTLRDSSHPVRGGSQVRPIAVRARSSLDTTQDFTIPRADYELWKRGTRPRLIVEALTPSGQRITEVLRLDPAAGRKAN